MTDRTGIEWIRKHCEPWLFTTPTQVCSRCWAPHICAREGHDWWGWFESASDMLAAVWHFWCSRPDDTVRAAW